MAEAKQQSKGRFRMWLDKRREAQRRGAEMTARVNATRKADTDRARRSGHTGGDGGGGIGPGGF
jgi:hypothetical protein